MKNTRGLKVQAIIISVDSGNLRFSELNFIDVVQLQELRGSTNLTNVDYITIENQKEIFYLGGTVLTDDIEGKVVEVDGNNTVFAIMVVPDDGRTIVLDQLGKGDSKVLIPPVRPPV